MATKVYNKVKSKPYLALQEKYRLLKKEHRKLQREYKKYQDESIGWCVEDVLEQAKNDDIEISKAAAGRVLRRMISKHDASLGITWDTISIYLQQWEQDPERFK